MAHTESNTQIEISDLGGVWRRTLYIPPSGERDEESHVYWLQIGDLAGDIRAPTEIGPAQTAFVGRLTKKGRVFSWVPQFEYGSVTDGAPDEGYLTFEGDILREDGVHAAYLEHWKREETVSDTDQAFEFEVPDLGTGYLMQIGRFAFCAYPSPQGPVFVLAERKTTAHVVRLAVGDTAATGTPIQWPVVQDGQIIFSESNLGPSVTLKVRPVVSHLSQEGVSL